MATVEEACEALIETVMDFDDWESCCCSECVAYAASHAINVDDSRNLLLEELGAVARKLQKEEPAGAKPQEDVVFVPPRMTRTAFQACMLLDAWVVGSSAQLHEPSDEPRDVDIVVPLSRWHEIGPYIPGTATPTLYGGRRFEAEGTQIDIWPDDIGRLITAKQFKAAWHPKSGVRIEL